MGREEGKKGRSTAPVKKSNGEKGIGFSLLGVGLPYTDGKSARK
jgi:hypothetical protein